ncbi:4-hydroxy-2-oxo-heptane-1,7-dioate aldolase [Candidatus Bathyarchaeota archaeon]|nr:4-hydroxy-2-oxo-heptane-1,7-dioate aldolase [Candidatus Bathyarchaeota archaeon]MCK4439274.1 4-hydroxy-2-oxo-heptane-1,7-dioate aldolase [Candidatus Bathyarchaeota archaeon]
MRNELKRRLKADEQLYGTWITLEAPMVSEMMSTLGFDYFVIDTEHAPLDMRTAQTLMQAMHPTTKTTPIIRVWWNDIVAIKRALDVGAYGVLVPWVNNKEEAELAVKATRYAPDGLRGCGPRRAAMFDPDYFKTADEEIAVIVQIETKEAVANIEDICSVEGVDATYIGPADLSASHGHLGNMSHPDVQKAIDRVYDATKAAGLAAGIHQGSGSAIKKRMEKGYNLVTVGNDLIYMRMGVQNQFKELGIKK